LDKANAISQLESLLKILRMSTVHEMSAARDFYEELYSALSSLVFLLWNIFHYYVDYIGSL
jgi:hypothetical protein